MSTRKKKGSETKLVSLPPEEVRKLSKPREGFDVFASRLIALFRANKEALPANGLDLDGLEEHVRAYQALAEPVYEAEKQAERLRTTRLVHASNAWDTILDMYARAVAAGRGNTDIQAGIADFVAFMRHAAKKKPKAPTPSGSTPSTPVTA